MAKAAEKRTKKNTRPAKDELVAQTFMNLVTRFSYQQGP